MTTEQYVLIGAGVIAAGGLGYLIYKHEQSQAAIAQANADAQAQVQAETDEENQYNLSNEIASLPSVSSLSTGTSSSINDTAEDVESSSPTTTSSSVDPTIASLVNAVVSSLSASPVNTSLPASASVVGQPIVNSYNPTDGIVAVGSPANGSTGISVNQINPVSYPATPAPIYSQSPNGQTNISTPTGSAIGGPILDPIQVANTSINAYTGVN
jgi:hypothetical protein